MDLINCLDDLKKRGLIFDQSDPEIASKLQPGDAFYVGFDPTAANLQIGNLVPLTVAMRLAAGGLRPLLLFGGAPGAIGDPSGKNEERKLLPREVIDANVARQSDKVKEIFARRGLEVQFVNNYDWTHSVSMLDFLRDTGKHFTVNYMLAKEVVKARLSGEGISYTEFSYMLLQAFDFLHLYQHEHCRLQIGGSDQWGNITSGLELIRRKVQGEAYAFCMPLITSSDGRKFGKSEGGAIWLNTAATSAYRFHQFWLNQEDQDAIRYLRIFTFLSDEELADLEEAVATRPEQREAQKRLADEVTTLVHGPEATQDAKRCAEVLFGRGDIRELSDVLLEEIFAEVPSSTIPRAEIDALNAADFLARAGATASKGEARRLISGGGAYINGERITDAAQPAKGFLREDSALVIVRTGKKSYHLVRTA